MTADIDGYRSELERNIFVGKPTKKIAKFHAAMIELQDAAFASIKPNGSFSDPDRAVKKLAKKKGLSRYLLHHSGHSIGLEGHETPVLNVAETAKFEPGMVFSVEPGIYIPGVGGFRHSDTVLVEEDGIQVISYYPRDIKSLAV